MRGKDVAWNDLVTFKDPTEYTSSDVFSEISEDFTQKRYDDWEYGCKFIQLKCITINFIKIKFIKIKFIKI